MWKRTNIILSNIEFIRVKKQPFSTNNSKIATLYFKKFSFIMKAETNQELNKSERRRNYD